MNIIENESVKQPSKLNLKSNYEIQAKAIKYDGTNLDEVLDFAGRDEVSLQKDRSIPDATNEYEARSRCHIRALDQGEFVLNMSLLGVYSKDEWKRLKPVLINNMTTVDHDETDGESK
jgi:hypothetical protein